MVSRLAGAIFSVSRSSVDKWRGDLVCRGSPSSRAHFTRSTRESEARHGYIARQGLVFRMRVHWDASRKGS